MNTVTSAVSGGDKWERRSRLHSWCVDAIANARAELDRVRQNSRHGAGRDVSNIVSQTTAIREPGRVSRDEAESFFLTFRCGWNPRIQAKEVRNRAGIVASAAWTNRRLVLHKRQEIGPRRRRNRYPDRAEYR